MVHTLMLFPYVKNNHTAGYPLTWNGMKNEATLFIRHMCANSIVNMIPLPKRDIFLHLFNIVRKQRFYGPRFTPF